MTAVELVPVSIPGAYFPIQTDGQGLAALRPMAEALGLDYSSQLAKLRKKSWATMANFTTVGADGKTREMVGVDRRTVGMWLATLEEHRVAEGRRAELRAYQAEAADALDAHFHGTPAAPAPPALSGAELMAAALVESQRVLEARETRINQLEDQQIADAPAVLYVAEFVADADTLTFSTVASSCGITEKALRELLIARDWIYVQTDSRWSNSKGRKVERNRYSEKATKKRHFQRILNHEAPRFRGGEVMHTLKITPFGAAAIARLVQEQAA